MNNQLPKDWKIVDISSIGRIETGSTPSKQNTVFYNNDYPFYKPTDLQAGYNVRIAKDNLSEAGIKQARYLPENSILVTCIGATIGKTGLIRKGGASNQQINAIIPAENVEPSFVYYQVIGPVFQKLIKDNASATTLPILNKTKFRNLPFVIAPIKKQQQIVSRIEELFSEVDKGIEELKTAQQQLKVYRQAVLKWAFEGKLTNKEVKEGELPAGWKIRSINEVAFINPKIPNKECIDEDLEIQFLPMKLVEEIINKFHLTETKKIKEAQRGSYTPFINGDLIFAKVTPCMENGKIAVVDNLKNGVGYGSSEFHVVRCSDQLLNKFLFYFVVQDRFRNEAQHAMTGAVGLRRVPKQFIENHSISLPTISEQQQIVQEIESRLSVCDKIEETITNSLKQSEALRQSILKKAFEGKFI